MRAKTLGVIFVIASSLLWAFQPILVKSSGATALQILGTASLAAGMVGLVFALLRRDRFAVEKAKIPAVVYVTIIGSVIADAIYIYSLQRVPALNAVLLAHVQPIFIVLIGAFFLKEDRVTIFDYLGILVMIVAALLVTTKSWDNALLMQFGTLGDLLVLVATVLWATTTIVARKYLSGVASSILVAYRYASAGILILGYVALTSGFRFDVFQLILGISIGFGMVLYYEALRRLKAAQTSALELTTPFFAAILGFAFLKETVSVMQIAGIALLLLGVHFLSKKEQ